MVGWDEDHTSTWSGVPRVTAIAWGLLSWLHHTHIHITTYNRVKNISLTGKMKQYTLVKNKRTNYVNAYYYSRTYIFQSFHRNILPFLFGYDIFYTTRYMDNILYGIFKMYIQVIICSGLQRKCLNGAIPHSPCIEAGLIPPPEYWEYWDWL